MALTRPSPCDAVSWSEGGARGGRRVPPAGRPAQEPSASGAAEMPPPCQRQAWGCGTLPAPTRTACLLMGQGPCVGNGRPLGASQTICRHPGTSWTQAGSSVAPCRGTGDVRRPAQGSLAPKAVLPAWSSPTRTSSGHPCQEGSCPSGASPAGATLAGVGALCSRGCFCVPLTASAFGT